MVSLDLPGQSFNGGMSREGQGLRGRELALLYFCELADLSAMVKGLWTNSGYRLL